ncbi:hypothetical protein PFY12_07480 [Chryseobacterium camelliae]|uniref:Uncharacterized protein n=1 Tax=Chryseobacterium camelliae TaxID=1265445 RepID=A0ABY7QRY0_9FLAO|nr:hypothetical protein [Chryseobacterium camelliae]WBV61949.1 hypothetical protein PFY12_07480 [Chryseobacterium camelliae]
MRIWISSILLLAALSCKKEAPSSGNTASKDSLSTTETRKDSLKTSQNKQTFNFVTELCDNKGLYDANKYSREEIEGTYKLWFQYSGLLLSKPSVFKPETLQEVRRDKDKILAKLDKDFAEKKKILEDLKIVNDPYWQNIRTQKIQELIQEYEFDKTEILAFSDPSVLLNSKFSKNCENFVRALNSDEDVMIDEWRKLRIQMSKKNGSPERVMDEFENNLHAQNRNEYAIVDLITFGWGNCANNSIKRIEHDEKMMKAFNALFITIDSECDEP